MGLKIRDLLIGPPLATFELAEKRLNKIRALAAFSPDALSSIAYANQEIYLGLVVAGSAGLSLIFPVSLAIAILLIIVAFSYFQTINAYPSGGGSYVVARENLGTSFGLIAAAALMIGYLLTAAVSLTAGVEAIASAFPTLWPHRVAVSLLFLFIITLMNLRGMQETGTLMAIPVYLFLAGYLPLLGYGLVRILLDGVGSLATAAPHATKPLSMFIILHAFAAGCTALTGIEAISNGVPVFHKPESRNAGRTLLVMTALMGVLFIGSIGLIHGLAVITGPQETILSALTRRLLGHGILYYMIQATTMLILTVAANTSFAGFPRLVALLASDKFLPRQLTNLGDRLVFSNGILLLAICTGGLIVIFRGNTHALVPLFAVGVFSAFTLSQAGMVLHWWRNRGGRWVIKFVVNAIGAIATAIAVGIIGVSKFVEGAWITIFLVPSIVFVFYKIKWHYEEVGRQLSLRGLPPSLRPIPFSRVIIPISGVHRGIIEAVTFAQSISNNVTAVYIELDPGMGEGVRREWNKWWPDVPLVVIASPYRSIIRPLLDYLDETDRQHHDGQQATVVLPDFVPARWWQSLLHNQTAWLIRAALLYRRRYLGYQRAIIDVPYHLKK
jgi:amino acid transporter